MSTTYITIDTETDGLDDTVNRIAEIGAVATDENGKLLDVFQSYVRYSEDKYQFNFQCEAFVGNGENYLGNGITNYHIGNAPNNWDVIGDFDTWITNFDPRVFVFKNAPFDIGFLKKAFSIAGFPEKSQSLFHRVLDITTLGFAVLPGNRVLSLEKLGKELGIPNSRPHGAMTDAIQTSNIFHELKRRLAAPKVVVPTYQGLPQSIPATNPADWTYYPNYPILYTRPIGDQTNG